MDTNPNPDLTSATTAAGNAGRALGEAHREIAAGLIPIHAFLCPGDMTEYEIVLVPRTHSIRFNPDGSSSAHLPPRHEPWYVVVNGIGYPWGETITVEAPYATEKWTRSRSDKWTGAIVAAFLTAFAHGLHGTTPEEG